MKNVPFKSSAIRSTVKGVVLGSAVAVPMMAAAFPAAAAEQAEIDQLKSQINALEDKVAALSSEEDTDKSRAGMTIGDTTVEIGGYVKLDVGYDFEGDQGASLGPSDIADQVGLSGDAEEDDPHLGFTAKQTRLTISTTTPTAAGDIGGYIEMDMYGEDFSWDGGGEPRLRQAYITWNNWLFGRAWSTFSNFYYGTTLNFYGPEGQVFSRSEQIRYTFEPSDVMNFAVAIEDASGTFRSYAADAGDPTDPTDDVVVGSSASSEDPLPDLTARWQVNSGPFSFQVAGLARQIVADVPGGDEESVFAWGVNVGGSVSLPTGTTIMLTAAGGDGVGRYVYAPAGAPAAYVDQDGDLETIERWGYIGTISQALTEQLTANVVYGVGVSDDPENVLGGAGTTALEHDKSTSLSVNLLYEPVEHLMFGIEFDRVSWEVESGEDADTNRIQFATQYNF